MDLGGGQPTCCFGRGGPVVYANESRLHLREARSAMAAESASHAAMAAREAADDSGPGEQRDSYNMHMYIHIHICIYTNTYIGLRVHPNQRATWPWRRAKPPMIRDQVRRSAGHTHTRTQRTIPPTLTHTHTTRTIPQTPKRTPLGTRCTKGLTLITQRANPYNMYIHIYIYIYSCAYTSTYRADLSQRSSFTGLTHEAADDSGPGEQKANPYHMYIYIRIHICIYIYTYTYIVS